MTDSEIVNCAKGCINSVPQCNSCPYDKVSEVVGECENALIKDLVDVADRLQAENERLNFLLNDAYENNRGLVELLERAKAEAYKEFAERLKAKAEIIPEARLIVIKENDWYNLLEEMVGDSQ